MDSAKVGRMTSRYPRKANRLATDCQVAYLTGDNPATLLSFALES